MKKTAFLIGFVFLTTVTFSQTNPNYKEPATTVDAQNQVVQPQNTNPNPQREVITPNTQPNVQPPQYQIPSPQSQNNAMYQDNAKFYNKDNAVKGIETNTNRIPTSNGQYSQPSYSNPNNRPSTQ